MVLSGVLGSETGSIQFSKEPIETDFLSFHLHNVQHDVAYLPFYRFYDQVSLPGSRLRNEA
jgi:hypothetical protein